MMILTVVIANTDNQKRLQVLAAVLVYVLLSAALALKIMGVE